MEQKGPDFHEKESGKWHQKVKRRDPKPTKEQHYCPRLKDPQIPKWQMIQMLKAQYANSLIRQKLNMSNVQNGKCSNSECSKCQMPKMPNAQNAYPMPNAQNPNFQSAKCIAKCSECQMIRGPTYQSYRNSKCQMLTVPNVRSSKY